MKAYGTTVRPRLILNRGHKNLSAQIVDDIHKRTILSLSTSHKDIKSKVSSGANIKAAEVFGEVLAGKAKEKGINKIIFDRAGYLYHGRIKAFADALRKGGLEF
jgi:large subunit ribosomal protein L18